MDRTKAKTESLKWLERVGLDDRAGDKLDTLSKGNQQKVQFISSILHRPDFAALDEPFSGMDPVNQEFFLEIIRELRPQLEMLGFNFEDLGKNTFVITGIPVDIVNNSGKELLEKILDNYKKNLLDLDQDHRVLLARAMALNMAMKASKTMSSEEMESLVSQLFSSSMPDTSPDGKKIIYTLGEAEIEKLF